MNKLYTKQELKTMDDVLDMAMIADRQRKSIAMTGSDTANKMGLGLSINSILWMDCTRVS